MTSSLFPIGGHMDIGALDSSFERVPEHYAALGAHYTGLAWPPPAYWNAKG